MDFKNETAFRRAVVAHAHKQGWSVHTDPDLRLRMGDPGFVDLVLVRGTWPKPDNAGRSRALFRECKMPGNYLSPEQWRWRLMLEAAGLDYAVWYPKDWPDIERELA